MGKEGRIEIRRASMDDLRPLAAVHLESWFSTYRSIYADEFVEERANMKFFLGLWTGYLEDPLKPVFAADLFGQASGFVRFSKHMSELLSLYVLPQAQGKGIGAALLDTAECELRRGGCEAVTANVVKDLSSSIRFYESQGWAIESQIEIENDGYSIEMFTIRKEL